MGNSIAPAGNNDVVSTPQEWAREIVEFYKPSGSLCDPCAGPGDNKPFATEMGKLYSASVDFYEITEGKDFLECRKKYDWVITNPPWGKRFWPIVEHSMNCAKNVVMLVNENVWSTKHRLSSLEYFGFGIRHHLMLPTPPKPWPQSGFQLCATYIKRGWNGPTYRSRRTIIESE